jgi:hypothetical protein
MYNSTFICTYNFYDSSLALTNPCSKALFEENPNFHEEPESELLEMAEFLYKNELLTAFNLIDFDEKNINASIKNLYMVIICDDVCSQYFKNICKSVAAKVLSEDLEVGFTMLFSYSYFHLTHLCLCDFLNNKMIREEYLDALKEILDKK